MSEKQIFGRISGIKRFAVHDGNGIRTTVFFKGCPLRCVWCHNPESIEYGAEQAYFSHLCHHCASCLGEQCPFGTRVVYGEQVDAETLSERLLADRPFFEASHGGVTLSGGECLTQPDFALALAKRLHTEGISVDIDTCGYVPWQVLEATLPYTDTYLYDIKAIDADVHLRCTGRDNALILENLKKLSERRAKIEIRIPFVTGYNDGEIEKIGAFLSRIGGISRVKVLAYHDFARSRYAALGKPDSMPQTKAEPQAIRHAVSLLREYGLDAVSGADA